MIKGLFENEVVLGDEQSPVAKLDAKKLFHQAYQAQLEDNYEEAIELYQRSIETYPTAEAHTFLGWVYSFQDRYDEAIAECLEAIRVDEAFGNPYNDIGSYLLAQAIVTVVSAGSSARCWRHVTNHMRFRISIL